MYRGERPDVKSQTFVARSSSSPRRNQTQEKACAAQRAASVSESVGFRARRRTWRGGRWSPCPRPPRAAPPRPFGETRTASTASARPAEIKRNPARSQYALYCQRAGSSLIPPDGAIKRNQPQSQYGVCSQSKASSYIPSTTRTKQDFFSSFFFLGTWSKLSRLRPPFSSQNLGGTDPASVPGFA